MPPEPRPRAPSASVSCAVVTVTDARSEDEDAAGALARDRLHAAGHLVEFYRMVPDDTEKVRGVLVHLAGQVEVVITVGGAGPGRRDTAVEVAETLIRKPLPGFGELFRVLWFEQAGSRALLTRALAGVYGPPAEPEAPPSTLLFCCPDAADALTLALDRLIVPDLRLIVEGAV